MMEHSRVVTKLKKRQKRQSRIVGIEVNIFIGVVFFKAQASMCYVSPSMNVLAGVMCSRFCQSQEVLESATAREKMNLGWLRRFGYR